MDHSKKHSKNISCYFMKYSAKLIIADIEINTCSREDRMWNWYLEDP